MDHRQQASLLSHHDFWTISAVEGVLEGLVEKSTETSKSAAVLPTGVSCSSSSKLGPKHLFISKLPVKLADLGELALNKKEKEKKKKNKEEGLTEQVGGLITAAARSDRWPRMGVDIELRSSLIPGPRHCSRSQGHHSRSGKILAERQFLQRRPSACCEREPSMASPLMVPFQPQTEDPDLAKKRRLSLLSLGANSTTMPEGHVQSCEASPCLEKRCALTPLHTVPALPLPGRLMLAGTEHTWRPGRSSVLDLLRWITWRRASGEALQVSASSPPTLPGPMAAAVCGLKVRTYDCRQPWDEASEIWSPALISRAVVILDYRAPSTFGLAPACPGLLNLQLVQQLLLQKLTTAVLQARNSLRVLRLPASRLEAHPHPSLRSQRPCGDEREL